jgi:hypothetical protein
MRKPLVEKWQAPAQPAKKEHNYLGRSAKRIGSPTSVSIWGMQSYSIANAKKSSAVTMREKAQPKTQTAPACGVAWRITAGKTPPSLPNPWRKQSKMLVPGSSHCAHNKPIPRTDMSRTAAV